MTLSRPATKTVDPLCHLISPGRQDAISPFAQSALNGRKISNFFHDHPDPGKQIEPVQTRLLIIIIDSHIFKETVNRGTQARRVTASARSLYRYRQQAWRQAHRNAHAAQFLHHP